MTITQRLHTIHQIIDETCNFYHRTEKVELLAVSKGQPVEALIEAYAAGIRNFGENYWQEAQFKIQQLADLDIVWHFIGPIQSNKCKEIAQHCDWVHSVDREKIADLLAKHRPLHLRPLNICIQVNLDKEATKSGLDLADLETFILRINKLPQLRLRGLMAIPLPLEDEEQQYLSFLRLSQTLITINQRLNLQLDTLSMGMSDDLKAAIRAGSTMLRIGTAIFGPRKTLI